VSDFRPTTTTTTTAAAAAYQVANKIMVQCWLWEGEAVVLVAEHVNHHRSARLRMGRGNRCWNRNGSGE
jgi:hypothetical protein